MGAKDENAVVAILDPRSFLTPKQRCLKSGAGENRGQLKSLLLLPSPKQTLKSIAVPCELLFVKRRALVSSLCRPRQLLTRLPLGSPSSCPPLPSHGTNHPSGNRALGPTVLGAHAQREGKAGTKVVAKPLGAGRPAAAADPGTPGHSVAPAPPRPLQLGTVRNADAPRRPAGRESRGGPAPRAR